MLQERRGKIYYVVCLGFVVLLIEKKNIYIVNYYLFVNLIILYHKKLLYLFI